MKILYTGLEPPSPTEENFNKEVFHFPFIRILPKSARDPNIVKAFANFKNYTHLIFTSKSAVSIFFSLTSNFNIKLNAIKIKIIISIGQQTAKALKKNSICPSIISAVETAEGVVNELKKLNLKHAHFFLPQSSLSRPVISQWLGQEEISYTSCPIYETVPSVTLPFPDLTSFDEIIFTSPSTIEAFLLAYGSLPKNKRLTCIGPVTKNHLNLKMNLFS